MYRRSGVQDLTCHESSSQSRHRTKRGAEFSSEVRLLLLCSCSSGAVQCGAVRCGVVRCGAVQCGVVQCGAVCAVWCGVVQCGTVPCRAVPCLAVLCRVCVCVHACVHTYVLRVRGMTYVRTYVHVLDDYCSCSCRYCSCCVYCSSGASRIPRCVRANPKMIDEVHLGGLRVRREGERSERRCWRCRHHCCHHCCCCC